MIKYEKRLLKELTTGYKHLTADDYASIWKRSASDVRLAAQNLRTLGKIKVAFNGALSLKGKHNAK